MSYLANTIGKRTRNVFVFKPLGSFNSFSGMDASGQVLKFTPNYQSTSVYVNGICLAPEDWAGDAAGTTVTIARYLNTGDVIVVVAEASYGVADVMKGSNNLSELTNKDAALANLWTPTVITKCYRGIGQEVFAQDTKYIVIGTASINVGGWTYANQYIVVPVTGYYRITNRVYVNGSSGGRVGVTVNDNQDTGWCGHAYVQTTTGNYTTEGSATTLLTAGDRLSYLCTIGQVTLYTAVNHSEIVVELLKRTA